MFSAPLYAPSRIIQIHPEPELREGASQKTLTAFNYTQERHK
jgi:hypothetical protein